MSDDDFELEPRRVGAPEDDSWIDKEDDANSKDKEKDEDSNDSFRPRKRRSQFLDDEAGVDKDDEKDDDPFFVEDDEAEKEDEEGAASRMSAISKSSKGSRKEEKENKEGRKKSPSRRVELDSDENTNMSADLGEIKKRYGFNNDGMSALEEFGFGTASVPAGNDKQTDFGEFDILDKPLDDFIVNDPPPKPVAAEYKPPVVPERFVSGSTPSSLSHRYLKWNTYGVVRSFANDTGSSIEIEFHDSTIHPEIVLDNDDTRYSLADISSKAVALASQEDKDESSELFVIHVASWDSESRRWNVTMPKKDGAVDLLVSRDLIAVLTKQNHIRTFTLTGTQRHVISHPGAFLTAAIYDSRIAICGTVGNYFLEGKKKAVEFTYSVSMYNLDRNWHKQSSNVTSILLPVKKSTQLLWLGFTNAGQLAFMDSNFVFHLRSPDGLWMPIFDGSTEIKAKSDSIWPIAIIETPQRNLRYLYNRGSKYPLVTLKTAPIVINWNLPLCAPESDKSKLEQEILLNELSQNEANSVEDLDKLSSLQVSHLQSLIKLFALACKSERDSRAAELAEFVGSAKGIQMMCNYASKLRKTALADKIAAVGREKMDNSSILMDSQRHVPREEIAPRRISIKAKRRPSNFSTLDDGNESDDSSASQVTSVVPDSQQISSTQQSIVSVTTSQLVTHAAIANSRISRNPFKRQEEQSNASFNSSSLSVFAELESAGDVSDRKRSAAFEKEPIKKQAKLSFGASKTIGKENDESVSPYSLWLTESESDLREQFAGDADDFTKFCTQRFRMLSAAEKKIWKDKASCITAT